MGIEDPTEQIEGIGASRVELIDSDVRSELATYNSVPPLRQARFEIDIRRDKSVDHYQNAATKLLHSTNIGATTTVQ